MSRPDKRRSQPVRAGLGESDRLGGHREYSTGVGTAPLHLAYRFGKLGPTPVASVDDLRREARIAMLANRCASAREAGDHAGAMAAWDELRHAIFGRSPEQITRMEQRFMPSSRRAEGARND